MIDKFIAVCQSNSFDKLQEQVNNVVCEGYSTVTFIEQVQQKIISSKELSDTQKAKISIKMAEVDASLLEGASEFLQLLDLGSTMLQVLCK